MSPSTMIHEALLYDSAESFVQTVVPFLQEGLAAGEGAVVATDEVKTSLIRDALGSDAGQVIFRDAAEVYRKPESAVAAYDAILTTLTDAGFPRVRAVGEVQHGTERRERWLTYEPVAEHIFRDRPLWALCSYDARTLPKWLLDHARESHRFLREPTQRIETKSFVEADVLLARAASPTLKPHGPPQLQISVSGSLRRARAQLHESLQGSGIETETVLVVVNELAANAIRHGGGVAYVSLWTVEGGVVCDVVDPGGRLDDPFAGYHPPATPHQGGMGLWIARQLSDELTLMPGRGLTIRAGFFVSSA